MRLTKMFHKMTLTKRLTKMYSKYWSHKTDPQYEIQKTEVREKY